MIEPVPLVLFRATQMLYRIPFRWPVLLAVVASCLFLLSGCGQPTSSPTPTSKPAPTSIPTSSEANVGVFDWVGQETNDIPIPLPPNTKGAAFTVPWARVEPADGTFDWTPIIRVEANLTAGHYIQVDILTGLQSPTSTAVGATWLRDEGVEGVPVHWDKSFRYPLCTPMYEPAPGDPLYQLKLEGLISAFETQFSGDPKVALVTISPISWTGDDVTLTTSSSASGCTESYTSAWNGISMTAGCASGDETCWRDNYIVPAFEKIWNYEIAHMPDQNLALWIQSPEDFATVTGSPDPDINVSIFSYAGANKPARAKYYIAQEALRNSNFVQNVTAPYAPGADGVGAQMVDPFNNDCTTLCQAGVTYGAYNGIKFEQVYNSNFSACPSTIADISSALNGTQGLGC
jgi:hypothetical protein